MRAQRFDMATRRTMLVIGRATGSGKTTQIPQYILEAGYSGNGLIGSIQPGRDAVISASNRVAQEMGVQLGHEVGYAVPCDNRTSDSTVLKFMTTDILLQEILTEKKLTRYSVVIIDEAHERKVAIDILLGVLQERCAQEGIPKLLISNATIDASKFSQFLDGASIFGIPGTTRESCPI